MITHILEATSPTIIDEILQTLESYVSNWADRFIQDNDDTFACEYFIEGIAFDQYQEHYYAVVWFSWHMDNESAIEREDLPDEEYEEWEEISDGYGLSIDRDYKGKWDVQIEDQGVELEHEETILWRNSNIPSWFAS